MTEDTLKVDPVGSGRMIILFMKCLGLWYIDSVWYKVYRYILHLVFTLTFISLMYINFWFIKGIDEFVDTLYMSLTETALLAKVMSVFYYGRKVVVFTELMEDPILRLRSSSEKEYFLKAHKIFNFMRKFYISISLGFCALSFADPFIRPNWKLPFPAWMPFNWESWSMYFYAYSYEVIGMLVTCVSNCTLDFFQAFVLMQISLYYKIICFRLENIGLEKGNPEMQLKKAIRMRIFVDKMAKDCETIVSIPILVQTTLSALVLCFTGYQLQSMSILETPGPFIQFLDYAVVMALQIYLPCYHGNEITINSSNLSNALYHSNWIDFDIKTKKIMYIYMEYLKRPVVLKAGNFFKIGLGVFSKVINNAYSLFALLINMNN